MAGYITARTDVDLDTLHNMLFHAYAINMLLTGRRLFSEGFLLRDSGIMIPSVERLAIDIGGACKVASSIRMSIGYRKLADVAMTYQSAPRPVAIVNVGRLDGRCSPARLTN